MKCGAIHPTLLFFFFLLISHLPSFRAYASTRTYGTTARTALPPMPLGQRPDAHSRARHGARKLAARTRWSSSNATIKLILGYMLFY